MKKALALMLLLSILVLFAASCGKEKPPESDKPEPETHKGVFVSEEYGSFTFNGDGKSIAVDATKAFSEKSGLPEGKSEGTYVFLFQNGQYRYDLAEDLRITVDGEKYTFPNDINETNEDTIAIYIDGEAVMFSKD